MNEELQKRVFEWVSTTAQTIGEWGSKEVPAFIQEFLTWKFYESLIPIIGYTFWLIFLLVMVFKAVVPCFKWAWKEMDQNDAHPAMMAPIVLSIALVGISCCYFPYQQIMNCVQIKVAPKVYLVEEAAKLIKGQ